MHFPKLCVSAEKCALIEESLASIDAVPLVVLPSGPAREALLALAAAGHDISLYPTMCERTYTLWIRPRYPWQEGRIPLDTFVAAVAEVGDASDALAAVGALARIFADRLPPEALATVAHTITRHTGSSPTATGQDGTAEGEARA